MLQRGRAALERGELDAELPTPSALGCEAARGETAVLRTEVEQAKALLAAPSIAAAQAELVRAGGLSGSARLRALSRARLLLESVTKVRAEPVVLRAPHLFPSIEPVETAKLGGTSFAVAGDAALEDPGGALVIHEGRLVRYRPDPTTVIGSGAEWPLVMTAHHVRTGSGSNARFADLTSDPPRELTHDDLTFKLPDGSGRLLVTGNDVRLSLASGAPVTLDPRGNLAFIDDIASRVVTYWPLGPMGPTDTHVLELNVFDAKDGRRIARSTDPPHDAVATPTITVSADGTRLVLTTSNETSVLTFKTGTWKTIGTYTLELLGGGAFGSAFTSDGSHLCAAWQDTFHVVPNDLPQNTDAICVFEPSSPFHTDVRIGCVEREQGWVATRSAARPVSVTGAAIATGVRKVAVLENAAGVNPLPGGLMVGPKVAVRLVIADADTCKIERRIDLGQRSLDNHETVAISADGSIVALSGEAFESGTGKPTTWSAAGMPSSEAREARGSAAQTLAAFHLTGDSSGRLETTESHGVVRVLDASRQPLATLIGSDPSNRAAFFPDRSHRFEGDFQRDARCRFGVVLAPIELCPPARDAADVEALLQGERR